MIPRTVHDRPITSTRPQPSEPQRVGAAPITSNPRFGQLKISDLGRRILRKYPRRFSAVPQNEYSVQ